ncbi:uncharacterized protein CLAFUR5_07090 [Fulvia fulva]|uniref:Uncharacterized protein n=1 Tax=Passalora fulva TaxID=5499 RepID=A0A9Q8UQF5_PASFU|nr:uncharacterized protein CLAFUR5_07090 [Fulvia fulva]KAK4623088.1 hypothetical protein CLAFUR0_06960 [Fulvia fulva]UJO18759.1 hypothetical protein CLAFUR5_07090 [Fulvia fulva]
MASYEISKSSSPMPSPSAAAQVFAISEFLEHILTTLAYRLSDHLVTHYHIKDDLEPMTTLARCQAVSRGFHATGETALQWLFEHHLQMKFWTTYQVWDWSQRTWRLPLANYELGVKTSDVPLAMIPRSAMPGASGILTQGGFFDKFSKVYGDPVATWRRTKLQIPSRSMEFRHSETQGAPKLKGHVVSFQGHQTLGEVFDKYCEILKEIVEGHVAHIEEQGGMVESK